MSYCYSLRGRDVERFRQQLGGGRRGWEHDGSSGIRGEFRSAFAAPAQRSSHEGFGMFFFIRSYSEIDLKCIFCKNRSGLATRGRR